MHHEQEQQNGCNTVFPRDRVCLRNISVNTPHKDDDDDNNNGHGTHTSENTNVKVQYSRFNWK
jgi:hypothetical protein